VEGWAAGLAVTAKVGGDDAVILSQRADERGPHAEVVGGVVEEDDGGSFGIAEVFEVYDKFAGAFEFRHWPRVRREQGTGNREQGTGGHSPYGLYRLSPGDGWAACRAGLAQTLGGSGATAYRTRMRRGLEW